MKYYIEYLIGGTAAQTGSTLKELKSSRKLPKKFPDDCVGYRFFDKNKDGNRVNVSGYVYFGTKLSYAKVKRLKGQKTLKENMERNRIAYVVRTKGRKFYELKEGDNVV